MTPERWQQLKQLFQSALERSPAERSAFLAQACAGDEALRREVESLISSHDQAGDSIEAMAAEAATEMLADDRKIVGKRIGRYRVLSLIGQGGMGEVFLAQDMSLGRKVALKLLRTDFTRNEERLRRFRQEAQAASALNHPNILTIHEIGQEGPLHFMATEYVEGETLRQHISRARILLGQVLDVAVQVASALSAAHQAGIVHRDIKPENVMLRTDGYVKVLDFGLAKLTDPKTAHSEAPTLVKVETEPGVVMGTFSYMSPEQARGLAVDARTDIWSLGVMIYEMAVGRQPFEGETPSDVMSLILQKEPMPLAHSWPEVPSELERIVRKALRKDKEERYQTVKDLLIDLKSLRRELELKAELERSVQPEMGGKAAAAVSEPAAAGTVSQPTPQTERVGAAQPTSSAEYIVTGIKRHKRGAIITLAAVALAAATSFFYFNRAPALTERDTILPADFVNTTGDAVFDGTLKQALAVQLGQSPFLNIFPEERVRETLRYMNRSPDERVTREVAREICQRQGIKAMLLGSISNLGGRYVISLEAINAQTGDALAREQAEAEGKEQVLRRLGEAATSLREKLGESLASIQRFDTPVEQATTSSLEALRAFSLGNEQQDKGQYLEAIPFYRRAIELDPNFALAYARLSTAYDNTGQRELSIEYAQKAFELRERVSERERLFITSYYYNYATREIDKAIESLQVWKRTYPRDFLPRNALARQYNRTAQFEKAIEEAREAIRLNPNSASAYGSLGLAFERLNRFDEAKEIYERALAQGLPFHAALYWIAFLHTDQAAMQQQIDQMKGTPEENEVSHLQAAVAGFYGQLRPHREFSNRSVDLALRRNLRELAAANASGDALRHAVVGDCRQIREDIAKALAIARTDISLMHDGTALALCGELGQAQALTDELLRRNPKDTLVNDVWVPVLQAAIEIHRGNPAKAIQLLQSASRYEAATFSWPAYLRGLAYLQQREGTEAMAEFQKILDNRGWDIANILYPLSQLGLARAAALTGDTATSRKAYEDFFALWKDADPDVPILIEAKKEYQKLR